MSLLNNIIAKRVISKYKQDMGNYFDFIQGNEEDVVICRMYSFTLSMLYSDVLAIIERAPLQYKVKMLLSGKVK